MAVLHGLKVQNLYYTMPLTVRLPLFILRKSITPFYLLSHYSGVPLPSMPQGSHWRNKFLFGLNYHPGDVDLYTSRLIVKTMPLLGEQPVLY